MERSTVLGIVVLAALLVAVLGYVAFKPAPAKAPGTIAPLSLPEGSYSEHAPYYDISADYATSTTLKEPANTVAIANMKNFVGSTIAQFLADGNFANLTPRDIQTMGFDQGKKEKLQIVYMMASSPRSVSYIFTTYMDTLGAHGNMFFHTFVFDTKNGTALTLSDIFLPGTRYLDALSSLSRAKLPAVIGDSADAGFIKNGTTPEEKNFSSFFLDNNQIVVLFDPYAVAPYSSGPQTLRIPLSELSSILKPEYR